MGGTIKHDAVRHLKRAVATLQGEQESAGAWDTITSLAKLSESGHAFTIDFRATEQVGTPVIVVHHRVASPVEFEQLTARQREVANMMLRGYPNKRIATELGISLGTAKDHVHAILLRLGFASRAALMAHANRSETR
ncbi:MAG: LuxR C-terminal-related transcriptional regulator [Devosia sp.]